ncbi:MAG: acyltransferase [Rhodospirillales bacterium]|nr:acyltransferase [Acetobacter sp.]
MAAARTDAACFLMDIAHATSATAIDARSKRFLALDGARWLASVAIVWLHVPKTQTLDATSTVGRFAVPFFTQVAVLLTYAAPERHPTLSLGRYAVGRFQRIYPVFLAWSVFYAATRWASHRLLHQPAYRPSAADLLWNGTALQLWFLPFILLATILTFMVRRGVDRWRVGAGGVVTAGLVAGVAVAVVPPTNLVASSLGYTGVFAWMALPSVCWAIGLAAARQTAPTALWKTPATAVVGTAFWVAGSAWTWLAGRQTFAENLAGLGLTLLVWYPGSERWLQPWAKWGFAAFGIYLVHPFWLEGFENVRRHFVTGDGLIFEGATFAFALVMSLASAWCLWRCRATRWLVA